MFRWLRRKHLKHSTAEQALVTLRDQIVRMNIPVVVDDFDAGYDMAVDEVLVLIDETLNPSTRSDDVTYGDSN